jgi:hypothetical protein
VGGTGSRQCPMTKFDISAVLLFMFGLTTNSVAQIIYETVVAAVTKKV